jgi:hypothetical protein
MAWVASTKHEGPWWFTASAMPETAVAILCDAITHRRVLSIPIDNPIRAVEFAQARIAAETAKQGLF